MLIFLPTLLAAQIIAVFEIVPSEDRIPMTVSEFQHLTDELRTQAREVLPKNYTILTREGIFQLLPPNEEEAECLLESCIVSIGRAIGADYVASGQVRMFGDMLTLTVELFESMSSNMLGSFVTESENTKGLLKAIRERAPALFKKMVPAEPPSPELQRLAKDDSPKISDNAPKISNAAPQTLRFGFTARSGILFSKYSVGAVAVKNLGFVDFVPELMFSSEAFDISEKRISLLKAEIPLRARIIFMRYFGVSAGTVLSLPAVKISSKVPSDAEKFGVAGIAGLTFAFTNNIFIDVLFERYFIDNFKSAKNANAGNVLCGIGYLF
jgi:hypothetical protein